MLFIQSAPMPTSRRLLWSVLFFKQSVSDIALFSSDGVIFSHWSRNITPPLMESRRCHPSPTKSPSIWRKKTLIQLNQNLEYCSF